MDLDNILEDMSKAVGKSKAYLKGLINSAKKVYDDQFGSSLEDDKKLEMAITKTGKKYDYAYVVDEPEDFDVSDLVDDNSIIITDDPDYGKPEKKTWERFMSTIPDKVEYVKLPSLIVEVGPTFYLRMSDLEEIPEGITFTGKHGEYVKFPLKVEFIKASDEDMYDNVYEKGDFEGKLMYVNNQEYTLWIDLKSSIFYKKFWLNTTDDGMPDKRIFTYKFTKKGKYNVYTYGLPKK